MSERDNVDALAVLWNTKIFRVEHFVEHFVSHLLQRTCDNFKCFSLVVNRQPFYVFAKDNFGFVVCANAGNIKEKSAARHAFVVIAKSFSLTS